MKSIKLSLSATLCPVFLLVLILFFAESASPSQSLERPFEALQKGQAVALIRHAIAPGTGDPPGFQLRAFLSTFFPKGPAIFVTHQVNITALTGVFPSSGEIIIFRTEENGEGKVLGRFTP